MSLPALLSLLRAQQTGHRGLLMAPTERQGLCWGRLHPGPQPSLAAPHSLASKEK